MNTVAAMMVVASLKTPSVPLWVTKEIYPDMTNSGMMAHNTKIVRSGMYVDFNRDGIGADISDGESVMQEIRGETPNCWSRIKDANVMDDTLQTYETAWRNFVIRWRSSS